MGRPKKSDPAAIGVLQTLLTAARAKDVIDHREMIGAPMTRRAAELLILKLAEAPDPNAAADMMIAKGWRGFDVGWVGQQLQKPQQFATKPTMANIFGQMEEFFDGSERQAGSDQTTQGTLLGLPFDGRKH